MPGTIAQLRAIRVEQFRMLLYRIVIERALIADVHMRIDQSRMRKPP